MKPLNQTERRSIYLRFLLLYVISIAAIIFTMYFYFTLPGKELEDLKAKNEKFKDFEKTPREVLEKMDALDPMLVSASDPKTLTSELKSNMDEAISEIKEKGKDPKNSMDSLYKKIALNYLNWKDAIDKVRESNQSTSIIKDLRTELTQTTKELDLCQQAKEMLKIQVGAGK